MTLEQECPYCEARATWHECCSQYDGSAGSSATQQCCAAGPLTWGHARGAPHAQPLWTGGAEGRLPALSSGSPQSTHHTLLLLACMRQLWHVHEEACTVCRRLTGGAVAAAGPVLAPRPGIAAGPELAPVQRAASLPRQRPPHLCGGHPNSCLRDHDPPALQPVGPGGRWHSH